MSDTRTVSHALYAGMAAIESERRITPMGSKKKSAQTKQREAFLSSFSANSHNAVDNMFAREAQRLEAAAAEREAALRNKACLSKNRYASKSEAEEAIASCAAHGTRNLHCYRCTYCKGWHLTSKPLRS